MVEINARTFDSLDIHIGQLLLLYYEIAIFYKGKMTCSGAGFKKQIIILLKTRKLIG
jgi:hypothetical protein